MPPSTDWKETPQGADEDARYLGYAEYLRELQRSSKTKGDRALHAKGNLQLEAELVVNDGLPAHARHGLGAKPGTYRAYVRLSNGMNQRGPDKKGDLRGFAVKVVGVDGKKLIPGMESARTQDFLCINTPFTSVKNTDEFIAIVKAARNPALLLPRLIGSVGLGRAFKILKVAAGDLGIKLLSVATTAYYTAAPISWGPYAAKVAFFPHQKDLPGTKRRDGPDYLGDELSARMKLAKQTWDFKAQFFTNEQETPIEDHDVEWKSEWVTIGSLTLPVQHADSTRGKKIAAFVEQASFDPWHALVEHKPIGNIMRARNHAYRLSTQERHAAKEPDGSETFD